MKCLSYLTTKRDVPSNATELPHPQHLLFSCIPVSSLHNRKAAKLPISLPHGTTLASIASVRVARSRCPGSAGPNLLRASWASAWGWYVMLLQYPWILARHRWKERKKERNNSKLHPQKKAGSNWLSPQSKGKKGRNNSKTQVFPGAAQPTPFIYN